MESMAYLQHCKTRRFIEIRYTAAQVFSCSKIFSVKRIVLLILAFWNSFSTINIVFVSFLYWNCQQPIAKSCHRWYNISASLLLQSVLAGEAACFFCGRRRFFFYLRPKSSFNPCRNASTLVTSFSSQYAISAFRNSSSYRILISYFLGFSVLGLPVRGLIKSPLFSEPTNIILAYGFQNVKIFLKKVWIFLYLLKNSSNWTVFSFLYFLESAFATVYICENGAILL